MAKKKDIVEETENVVENTNKIMANIEASMKRDMKDRNQILKDMEQSLLNHSKRLVEYDQIEKAYKLLEVKYNSLLKEHTEMENQATIQMETLTHNVQNLELENKLLKKLITENKRRISGLQSIVELMVNDYGMSNIEVVTGLSGEKIKEYFQD